MLFFVGLCILDLLGVTLLLKVQKPTQGVPMIFVPLFFSSSSSSFFFSRFFVFVFVFPLPATGDGAVAEGSVGSGPSVIGFPIA